MYMVDDVSMVNVVWNNTFRIEAYKINPDLDGRIYSIYLQTPIIKFISMTQKETQQRVCGFRFLAVHFFQTSPFQ